MIHLQIHITCTELMYSSVHSLFLDVNDDRLLTLDPKKNQWCEWSKNIDRNQQKLLGNLTALKHTASSQQRAGLADRILLGLLISASLSSWWWLLASADAGCFLALLGLEAQQVKCMRTQTLAQTYRIDIQGSRARKYRWRILKLWVCTLFSGWFSCHSVSRLSHCVYVYLAGAADFCCV